MAQAFNNGRLGEKHEWELPRLRESQQVPNSGDFWDVKFYPYIDADAEPIFAVVGNTNILICRTPREKNIEILVSIIDEDPENENYACAWSKDLETGTPLLCFGGSSGKIKIINALTGELLRVLTGHGGGIMTLEISPVNPQILASGGEDFTVRIWSLDPAHTRQPCAAILAGDGHRENILNVAFHATGRYLLSSGVDRVINLWVLPSFPDENTGTQKPTRIHYPHFSTSEVHNNIVDCVQFHNDLILSKAERESCIVLWSISGFSSLNPPPPHLSAPTAHDPARDTRSAFSTSATLYTRLLQFSVPDCDIMFMRFGLFPGLKPSSPGERERGPVLAMCNTASKIFYWDFGRLVQYWDYISSLPTSTSSSSTSDLLESAPPNSNQNPTSSQNQATGIGNGKAKEQEPSTSQPPPQPTAPTTSPTTQTKRPPFLIPFKPRARAPKNPTHSHLQSHSHSHAHPHPHPHSRLRDSSPTESDRSTPLTSSLPPPPHSSLSSASHEDKDNLDKSLEIWSRKYGINDPTKVLSAHKEEIVKGLSFVGRQVAWSRGGEWCIVVGSVGVLGVFERWEGR